MSNQNTSSSTPTRIPQNDTVVAAHPAVAPVQQVGSARVLLNSGLGGTTVAAEAKPSWSAVVSGRRPSTSPRFQPTASGATRVPSAVAVAPTQRVSARSPDPTPTRQQLRTSRSPRAVHWTLFGDVSKSNLQIGNGLRFRTALKHYAESPAACVNAYVRGKKAPRNGRLRKEYWDKLWKEWGNFAHATQWMFCDTVRVAAVGRNTATKAWKKAQVLSKMSLQARRVKDWLYTQVRRGDSQHSGFTDRIAKLASQIELVSRGKASAKQLKTLVNEVAKLKNRVYDDKLRLYSSEPGQGITVR